MVLNQPANLVTKLFVNPRCPAGDARAVQPLLASGEALVGWNFNTGARCGVVYRTGVWFRGFEKANVVDATLSYHVARSSSTAQGRPLSGNVSCAAQLQIATAMWMNNPDNPTALLGAPYLTFPANRPGDIEALGPFAITNGMFVAIDVTQAVRQWAGGIRQNFGFVLVPDHADFSGPDDHCYSVYSGFTLTVDAR